MAQAVAVAAAVTLTPLESLFSTIINPFSSSTNSSGASSPSPLLAIPTIHTLYLFSSHHPALTTILAFFLTIFLVIHFTIFTPPRSLAHLPRVSAYPILWSYMIRESVDVRMRKYVLPLADRGEGVVCVWMLGKWGVHLVCGDIVKHVTHAPTLYPKKNYQDHLHFTFLSGPNVVFSNGEMWKRHSESVKAAFEREIPVGTFVTLAGEVLAMIGEGTSIGRFSDLVQKYTLDVVGTTLLGHNFEALKSTSDSFVDHFNRVMSCIATPTRLIFPFLDTYFPRHHVIAEVDGLNARYEKVLEDKKKDLGVDLLSYLLEDERLSSEEVRSNLSILFSAGHDTTSGAISSLVYFFAKHPEYQAKAREEILEVLGPKQEAPEYKDHPQLRFLYACIKEAMRINPPISLLPARWTTEDVVFKSALGKEYVVPKDVSIVPNVYVIHHSKKAWGNPEEFDPYRFCGERLKKVKLSWHIPFGTGPRQCVARQFSLYEQRTLVAVLLLRYKWRLPQNSPHQKWVQNEFGAFGLSIPHHLDIEFVKL